MTVVLYNRNKIKGNFWKGASMEGKFYKQKKDRWFFGVLAGLSDKFGWNLNLVRVLFVLLLIFIQGGAFLYLILALILPYKEDLIKDAYGQGPRKRKEAEVIHDRKWFW